MLPYLLDDVGVREDLPSIRARGFKETDKIEHFGPLRFRQRSDFLEAHCRGGYGGLSSRFKFRIFYGPQTDSVHPKCRIRLAAGCRARTFLETLDTRRPWYRGPTAAARRADSSAQSCAVSNPTGLLVGGKVGKLRRLTRNSGGSATASCLQYYQS